MAVSHKVRLHRACIGMPPLSQLLPPFTLLAAFGCTQLAWSSLSSPLIALRWQATIVPTLMTTKVILMTTAACPTLVTTVHHASSNNCPTNIAPVALQRASGASHPMEASCPSATG